MATDILGRRLRHASPQPRGRHIELTERDLVLFETLQRHGPLPSTYLYESTKHLGRNETDLKHRLTKLYNGTVKGIAYLTRPPQQFAAYDARCQPGIYDLTLCAAGALAERGRGARFIIPRADPFLHRLMTACVGASIELAAREGGVRYLTKEDIFSHRSCPASTRSASNPLAVAANGKTFVPDDLFGFAYPGPRYRFFAVEIDRSTESIERRNVAQTAYGRKLEAYLTIMRDRTYRTHWGLPGLMVLTVTTSRTRCQHMIDYLVERAEPVLVQRFLFAAKTEFGPNWKVPGVMRDLFAASWQQADTSFFRIDQG